MIHDGFTRRGSPAPIGLAAVVLALALWAAGCSREAAETPGAQPEAGAAPAAVSDASEADPWLHADPGRDVARTIDEDAVAASEGSEADARQLDADDDPERGFERDRDRDREHVRDPGYDDEVPWGVVEALRAEVPPEPSPGDIAVLEAIAREQPTPSELQQLREAAAVMPSQQELDRLRREAEAARPTAEHLEMLRRQADIEPTPAQLEAARRAGR